LSLFWFEMKKVRHVFCMVCLATVVAGGALGEVSDTARIRMIQNELSTNEQRALYLELEQLAIKTGDEALLAKCCYELSYIYAQQSNYVKTFDYVQRALRYYEAQNDRAGRAACYRIMATLYIILSPEQADFYYRKCFELAEREDSVHAVLSRCMTPYQYYPRIDGFAKLTEIRNLNRRLLTDVQYAAVDHAYAVLARQEGDLDLAMSYALKADSFFSANPRLSSMNALNKKELASLYYSLGDLPKAKQTFATLLSQESKYDASARYYSAYIDYQQKKYDEALPVFLSLQENPDYVRIVPYYILQIYYSQKKYDEVIKSGEELLKKYPENENNAEVYRLLGECFFFRKDYMNTIKYLALYEKKATPVLRNNMYMLGIAYYETRQYKNAIPNLQKVTVIDDNMGQNAYLHLGSSYLKENDKTSARMAFESAARMDFDKNIQEEALYNYVLVVYEQSYSPFNESILAFERFLKEFPKSDYSDNIYDYLVNVYLTTKNYEAAYESIQKIKSKNPKILEARQRILYSIGIQNFTEANYDKAIKLFSESLEDAKSNRETEALALFWRGESYFRKKEYAKAASDYQSFLNSLGSRNSGEYNTAHYNLGYCYFSEKKYNEALNWFRKYTNLEEKNKTLIADANNRIGDCYFYNRDFKNAEKSYATVFALKGPGADYACFQQAFVEGLQKNYQGKIATLQKLIKTFPQSEYLADAMYEIGRSHIMLKDNKSAISTYDELALKYPHSPLSRKARLQTAMLYDDMNDYNKSISIYKEIVDYFPSSVEAKTALENLKTIYFEKDDLQTYADYVNSLGGIATFEKSA